MTIGNLSTPESLTFNVGNIFPSQCTVKYLGGELKNLVLIWLARSLRKASRHRYIDDLFITKLSILCPKASAVA